MLNSKLREYFVDAGKHGNIRPFETVFNHMHARQPSFPEESADAVEAWILFRDARIRILLYLNTRIAEKACAAWCDSLTPDEAEEVDRVVGKANHLGANTAKAWSEARWKLMKKWNFSGGGIPDWLEKSVERSFLMGRLERDEKDAKRLVWRKYSPATL